MRKIIESDIVGKTVKSIKNTCVNVLELTFSDNSKLELVAEDAVYTAVGNIPGIFVDDSDRPV
jgi:hypothetical protein